MGRVLAFLYGWVSYVISCFTALYAVGFVGNLFVPKSIDSGAADPLSQALLVNVLLLAIFALQHSVMARPAFKQWWIRFVPQAIERSTYVLLSSLSLMLLFWQWQPMDGYVWHVENKAVRMLVWGLFWTGWMIVLISTFLISHSDLFGLRQVYLHMKGEKYTYIAFTTPFLYQFVRHPIMLGFLIAFWTTPDMTLSHLVFAAGTTVYILLALRLEEQDLVNCYGAGYEAYQQRASMILPLPRKKWLRAPAIKKDVESRFARDHADER